MPLKAPCDDYYGYGEYGVDVCDYDEDDFFYHLYFDEVSTTPIPDEFYDLLESSNYPDYFDYFDKSIKNRTSDESDTTTARSTRQSENTQYLNSIEQKCERWPVQKCTIEQKFVIKYSPETSCVQVSRKLCAPKKCKESEVRLSIIF